MWGQPGKIKLTGFLSRGRAGNFSDAVTLALADSANIDSVGFYASHPGVSLSGEQQVTDTVGAFLRVG